MASDLAAVLARTVQAHASAIQHWEQPVRDDVVDSVHQMRVSARRLRSVLQIYAPLFEQDARGEINATLRRLGRRLSTARDAEVLRDLVEARVDGLPRDLTDALPQRTVTRLRRTTTQEHASAHARLLEVMDSSEHRDDLDRISAVARTEGLPLAHGLTSTQRDDPASAIAPIVRQRMAGIVTMAKGASAAPSPTDHNKQLHELRKEAKRVRYATAAVRDAGDLDLGPEIDASMRTAKRLQRCLGDHHDSVMLQELLLRCARGARTKDEDTFGYGVLYARESRVQDKALQKAAAHLAT